MKIKNPFILCLIATSFCFNPLFAKKVEVNVAKQVASNFFIEQSKTPLLAKSVSITQDFTVSDNSLPLYYVFNINNGFVIVSADDAVTPVLGYSNESTYSEENQSPEFAYWMDLYKKQIINVINTGYTGTAKIAAEWNRLNTASENFKAVKSTNPAVPPLTFTTWDQGCCYNAKCPFDATATQECSHVVTGCVATSMAQEMFYFKYPTQGAGSHSYSAGTYGTLSANFGTTTYSWNAMTLACTGENDDIANLMSQCGISVNMSYSPTGSGANMPAAVTALKNYFKYTTVKSANKSSYTDSTWEALLINELEAKRPMIYSGTDPSAGGHAWICDGYQVTSGSNYFHMNWGWSGNSNGYFLTSNLSAGGDVFSTYNGVIYNVIPSSNYPYECTGTKTITSDAGTIDDGSGPSNYLNNDDCRWLIAPADSVNHLMLAFDYLYTDSLKDVVTIYDGPTTSSPVLGTFSGNTTPTASITSHGSQVLVRFTSDSSVTDQGWQIHYSSVFPVYCSGLTTLTALTDTFGDGSGENNNYNNNSNCKWQISPPNAASVTLHFLEFDTDTIHDFIKIFDNGGGTSTVLKTLSGHTLPANVTSPSGQMMVMFQTDATITDKGWKAYYTTSMAGIEDFSIIKGLNIFPNPANTSLHVSFDLASGNNAKLELVNLTGQVVYTNELQANSTTFNNDINVSKLAKGIYTLRIISSGEIVNKKVVIE